LQGGCSDTGATPAALLALAILEIGSRFFFYSGQPGLQFSYFVLPAVAQLLVEMGVSLIFCLGWLQGAILSVSVSKVARITGVRRQQAC
jgi:hypothetical protein